MVNRERGMLRAAVLTPHTIATKDVFARQFDLPEWNPQIGAESDNGREWIIASHGADHLRRAVLNHFCFCQEEEHQCLLGTADADRLVGLVQDKNLCIER